MQRFYVFFIETLEGHRDPLLLGVRIISDRVLVPMVLQFLITAEQGAIVSIFTLKSFYRHSGYIVTERTPSEGCSLSENVETSFFNSLDADSTPELRRPAVFDILGGRTQGAARLHFDVQCQAAPASLPVPRNLAGENTSVDVLHVIETEIGRDDP